MADATGSSSGGGTATAAAGTGTTGGTPVDGGGSKPSAVNGLTDSVAVDKTTQAAIARGERVVLNRDILVGNDHVQDQIVISEGKPGAEEYAINMSGQFDKSGNLIPEKEITISWPPRSSGAGGGAKKEEKKEEKKKEDSDSTANDDKKKDDEDCDCGCNHDDDESVVDKRNATERPIESDGLTNTKDISRKNNIVDTSDLWPSFPFDNDDVTKPVTADPDDGYPDYYGGDADDDLPDEDLDVFKEGVHIDMDPQETNYYPSIDKNKKCLDIISFFFPDAEAESDKKINKWKIKEYIEDIYKKNGLAIKIGYYDSKSGEDRYKLWKDNTYMKNVQIVEIRTIKNNKESHNVIGTGKTNMVISSDDKERYEFVHYRRIKFNDHGDKGDINYAIAFAIAHEMLHNLLYQIAAYYGFSADNNSAFRALFELNETGHSTDRMANLILSGDEMGPMSMGPPITKRDSRALKHEYILDEMVHFIKKFLCDYGSNRFPPRLDEFASNTQYHEFIRIIEQIRKKRENVKTN